MKWNPIQWNDQTLFSSSGPRCFWPGIESGADQKFREFGTSMIYRKLKLVRNFKKSIQPNKSWEGNGSRKTVKLSFSYQVGCYVHLIPWTSFTSSTEYAWCVWRPTEAKTGSSCGCVSPPHDAPIKKLQVLNTRPHLHSIKRDESFTTIVQERILRASSTFRVASERSSEQRGQEKRRKPRALSFYPATHSRVSLRVPPTRDFSQLP